MEPKTKERKKRERSFKINCNSRAAIPKMLSLEKEKMVSLGWKVVEHQKNGILSWNPEKISLFVSDEQQEDDGFVSAPKLQKIFAERELKLLNSKVLDFLLRHKELIPESWKEEVVVFWGTIYEGPNKKLLVRTLEWRIDEFADSYMWLAAGFRPHELAAIVID